MGYSFLQRSNWSNVRCVIYLIGYIHVLKFDDVIISEGKCQYNSMGDRLFNGNFITLNPQTLDQIIVWELLDPQI